MKALKADDTTMVMDRVKKERMFAAQDAYVDLFPLCPWIRATQTVVSVCA